MKKNLALLSRARQLIDASDGTKFQKKVWRALLTIPFGEVRTYSWLAKKIGSPKATRAVGSACGANPFAPIVPCHRVVRNDGSLGGYSARGGIRKKLELLASEGADINVLRPKPRQPR